MKRKKKNRANEKNDEMEIIYAVHGQCANKNKQMYARAYN